MTTFQLHSALTTDHASHATSMQTCSHAPMNDHDQHDQVLESELKDATVERMRLALHIILHHEHMHLFEHDQVLESELKDATVERLSLAL